MGAVSPVPPRPAPPSPSRRNCHTLPRLAGNPSSLTSRPFSPPWPRRRPRPAVRASSAAATITQHSTTRRLIYFNDPAFSCIAARQTLNTQGKYQITPTILYTEGKQKLDPPPCLGRRRGAAAPRHPSGSGAAGHTPTGHSSRWLLTSLEASRPQKESPCLIRVSRVSCLGGRGWAGSWGTNRTRARARGGSGGGGDDPMIRLCRGAAPSRLPRTAQGRVWGWTHARRGLLSVCVCRGRMTPRVRVRLFFRSLRQLAYF